MLACLAGGILFLLFVGGRLLTDPVEMACIESGYGYLLAAGGVGGGLFVVAFYDWFAKAWQSLLDRLLGG